MALRKTRKIGRTNIEVPSAYCRLKAFRFDHPGRVWARVEVYEDKESSEMLDYIEYDFSADDFSEGDVSRKRIYVMLKSMDEWDGASNA